MTAHRRAGSTSKPLDNYPTPAWAILAALPDILTTPRAEDMIVRAEPRARPGLILEPAAGVGNVIAAMHAAGLGAHRYEAVEIRPEAAAACQQRFSRVRMTIGDFLAHRSEDVPDLVVMNPPYGGRSQDLARAFIAHALEIVRPNRFALVAALLRMNWYADGRTSGRLQWLKGSGLIRILHLGRRPSFTGDGASDASTYAWGIWRSPSSPDALTEPTTYRLLDCSVSAINERLTAAGLTPAAITEPRRTRAPGRK